MTREEIREFTIRDIIRLRSPKVVAIGGGTGLSSILRGLKRYTDQVTAIVTMGDDGGSSGRLRENLGLLPPGDVRNCILALADDEDMMQKLFNYRFESGELEGHSFGNLFLAAMDGISDDFYEAIRRTSDVLDIKGKVVPVTLDPMILEARLEDGTLVEGESEIPKIAWSRGSVIDKLYLKSPESVAPLGDALKAIREAGIIVLGPGSLYTSLISNLLVPGIAEEIERSGAKKYYIANLMTQPGETDNYTQADHLRAIRKHAGVDLFDTVIENSEKIPEEIISSYRAGGQEPVSGMESGEYRVLCGDIVSIEGGNIRHDAGELARILFEDYLKN